MMQLCVFCAVYVICVLTVYDVLRVAVLCYVARSGLAFEQ